MTGIESRLAHIPIIMSSGESFDGQEHIATICLTAGRENTILKISCYCKNKKDQFYGVILTRNARTHPDPPVG